MEGFLLAVKHLVEHLVDPLPICCLSHAHQITSDHFENTLIAREAYCIKGHGNLASAFP